jgi:hypothetical protein
MELTLTAGIDCKGGFSMMKSTFFRMVVVVIAMVVSAASLTFVGCAKAQEKPASESAAKSAATVAESVWQVVELQDEFGDPTGAKCLAALASGTFSNSATSNSALNVHIFVDGANECDLLFYEYGRPPAASFYNDTFAFSVKDGNGEKHSFYWSSPRFSSTFVSVAKDFLPILKMGGMVKVVATQGTTSYHFEIDATDFPGLFSTTFGGSCSFTVLTKDSLTITVAFEYPVKWDTSTTQMKAIVSNYFAGKWYKDLLTNESGKLVYDDGVIRDDFRYVDDEVTKLLEEYSVKNLKCSR